MEILKQLDLNSSFFAQLIIFTIAYVVLSNLVFKPYAKALAQRELKTKGGEEIAKQTQKETAELRSVYETKARQISTEINQIFDHHKSEATKEYDRIVTQARAESQRHIEMARQRIETEVASARTALASATSALADDISKKLVGK